MKRTCALLFVLLTLAFRVHAAPKDMVLQSTPSDCGPAALATLLDRYLAVPTTEEELVKLTNTRPKFGTTLMELEKAATEKGCAADSFRMNWKTLQEQVKSFPTPFIVRTLNPEPHFAVLLGIENGNIYLADPAAGHIMMSERAFLKRWLLPVVNEGYVFIAAGPEGFVDHERRTRVLNDFAYTRILMRFSSVIALPLLTTCLMPVAAHAQDLRYRLWRPSATEWNNDKVNLRLAQVDRPTTPSTTTPSAPAQPGSTDPNQAAPPSGGRKPIGFSVYTRFGFDSDKVLIATPTLVQFDVKRQIRTLVLAGDYQLGDKTRLSVSVPYIDQTTKNTSSIGGFTQRGNGIGDVSVWLEQSFPNYKKGHELSLATGMAFPTGKSPFNLGPTELETGLGFYQPMFRVTARTLRVPLQFFGSLDYSTSFSRENAGQKVKLPASYGGELGFFYTMGPEWTTQTSVSLGKVSSPFLQSSSASTGYLTQALSYRAGDRTSFRGSVDVGLTDESTDAYVGFSLNSSF
jgi:predicted double-glycine peptidase